MSHRRSAGIGARRSDAVVKFHGYQYWSGNWALVSKNSDYNGHSLNFDRNIF